MQWHLMAAGIALLVLAALLTILLGRKGADLAAQMTYRRLRFPGRLPALLQKAAALLASEHSALYSDLRALSEQVLHVRREIAAIPPLPTDPDGQIKLHSVAEAILDEADFTLSALQEALTKLHVDDLRPSEAAYLPACASVAQCSRLSDVLTGLLRDAKERRTAPRLARRMKRSRKPLLLVERSGLHSAGMNELLLNLRAAQASDLLARLDEWLEQKGTSAEQIAAQALERQLRFAEEIRQAGECFSALSRISWLPCCEEIDPVHKVLLDDPSGVYPRMEQRARLALRLSIETFARRVHMQPGEVLSNAMRLSQEADATSLEAYVGFWFQDAAGMRTLHRSLARKKGWLYARFALQHDLRRYLLLLLFGLLTGFLFLHFRQPVFMLPFFAWTVGCISRRIHSRRRSAPLPRMALAGDTQDLRTLVVLPAVLSDPHAAIRQVRRMKVLRQTFAETEADFLLLGDFGESMTVISSSDAPIIHAASAAIAALEDSRCMYLQRGRAWHPDRHICAAQGGDRGAVTSICRLIAQGECEDVIAHATVEAATFERRYAYVLVLPEGYMPAPGMLDELLQVMTHPMCSRYPAPDGWRGYSILTPEGAAQFESVGLIRPDAYLEATDGLVSRDQDAYALCGELAGHTAVPGALMDAPAFDASWDAMYHAARRVWQLVPWQLPWVHTPSGLIRNLLSFLSRFRLREPLRHALVPLGQCALLLWAVLTNSWPLLVLALIAPEVGNFPRRISDGIHLLCRLSLLPTRAILPLRALWDILRRKPMPANFIPLEVWTQGIAATIFAAVGLAIPGMSLPALALGVLFACFPLAHKYDGSELSSDAEGLTEEHTALLDQLAVGTWRFFRENMQAENHYLPPCSVQFDPPAGPESLTSPEAIAASLLACICAKELELISANGAAGHILPILQTLRELAMPFGLPCRRYALPSLTVQDARVDAAGVGLLLAAVMTTAQALRTWLPELKEEFLPLSADAEEVIRSFDLSRLYDSDANLFHLQLDENGQGVGYVTCFSDEALLLSVAACARRMIPPRHFASLSRASIRLHGWDIPLSRTGSATAYLLSSLFFPVDAQDTSGFIAAMQARGQQGLWGQSDCACFTFDPALRYQRAAFGLPEAALAVAAAAPVYAPYAAALCLPHEPHTSSDVLLRFHSLGAAGPMGMCDAVDLTHGQALVGLHDALHQGIMLIGITHLLADAPVQRFFCGLPEVEACLPLLNSRNPPLILPVLPGFKAADIPAAAAAYAASPRTEPPDMHLIGTADFRILADARGNFSLYDGAVPLTRLDAAATNIQGTQFYLADEGRVYRIGDPSSTGEVHFTPGEVHIEQLCGSLKAELVTVADTLRHRALHVLTITNLSTRDRVIDAADCLLPDLAVPPNTLEVHRPEPHRLLLHARTDGRELHHTLNCTQPPLSLTVCTDASDFLGRWRTLHAPASLEEPAHDQLSASTEPCLSFRVRLSLPGRGQATLWLTTSTQEHEPPQLAALPGIRRLAALQHEAIAASCAMDETRHALLRRLLPLLIRSDGRMVLHLTSEAQSRDVAALAAALSQLHMHGMETAVWGACPAEHQSNIHDLLQGLSIHEQFTLTDAPPPAGWENALILHDHDSFLRQLEAMYAPLPPEEPHQPARPALLPKAEFEHRSSYGGFAPDTGDYVIELEPGMTTPAPWENTHVSRAYRETVTESSFRAPFGEQVWLTLPDGTALSPWSPELPRSIRMSAGMTSWEAWSEQLDIRLSAACMPGHRCAVRVLRLRNSTDAPLDIRLTVHADLGSGVLDCAPDVVMGEADGRGLFPYLAGDGWIAQRVTPHPLSAPDAPPMDAPDHPQGRCALLIRTLTLPPQSSGEACWLAGHARHAEDTARALDALRQSGKSELLRSVQAQWARELSRLTISTPEDTLDLLMNSILPRQVLSGGGAGAIPALVHFAPHKAKWQLLDTTRHTHTRDEWAKLALHAAHYVRITGDARLLNVWLPHQEKTLYAACTDALLTLPLDHHGLPLGEDAAHRSLLFALAAQELDRCTPDPALSEFSRKLLNAADIYLWDDTCYGQPLRLDVQALSCMTYGANPRTRQSMRTAWMTLYDPFHGLIRREEPTEAPPLPGLPENGGMVTVDAVLAIRALLITAHFSEAHELLRALNPIHHSDDPQRMETFRAAPYRLHGGMYATPLEAGRAVSDSGLEAAALLYAVALEDILGLHREGSTLRIQPHVPPDWDDYALTLHEGTSTWHISVERHCKTLTIDGDESTGYTITLHDDGRIHQVRVPLQ